MSEGVVQQICTFPNCPVPEARQVWVSGRDALRILWSRPAHLDARRKPRVPYDVGARDESLRTKEIYEGWRPAGRA